MPMVSKRTVRRLSQVLFLMVPRRRSSVAGRDGWPQDDARSYRPVMPGGQKVRGDLGM